MSSPGLQGVTVNDLTNLHALCKGTGVHYVILGGVACSGLGSNCIAKDVDIVVLTGVGAGRDINSKIDALVKSSKGRFLAHTDQYGLSHFQLDGIDIGIFDPAAWPNRPRYSEFLSDGGSVYIGDRNEGFFVVSPPLLLREKLITLGERKGRAETDMLDTDVLWEYYQRARLTIGLSGDDLLSASVRKGLSEYAIMDGHVYPEVVL